MEMKDFASRRQMDMLTNGQFDDSLNTNYFRRLIRQPEPIFDFSEPLPHSPGRYLEVSKAA